jgi:hypothetical protein
MEQGSINNESILNVDDYTLVKNIFKKYNLNWKNDEVDKDLFSILKNSE